MAHAYKVIIERNTQGEYVATFPELLGCQAQAASLKTLLERIREATDSCPQEGAPTLVPQKLPGVVQDSPGGT